GRELAVVQIQLAGLQNDRARITAQATTAQSQIILIARRTPPERAIPLGDQALLASWTASLAGLNRQAFALDREITGLQRRAIELGAIGGQESETIAKAETRLRESDRQAGIAEKRLSRREGTKKARQDNPVG